MQVCWKDLKRRGNLGVWCGYHVAPCSSSSVGVNVGFNFSVCVEFSS